MTIFSRQPVTSDGLGAAPVPTRVRYGVVAFAVTLAVITYIDRVCIAQAAPLIRRDLGLTAVQMGFVFSVFVWTYGLFEVPWGWLADRIGPRKVLIRIVTCWSFFTAATGWTWNLSSLIVTRALFGVGEAGCFPTLTKAFTTWLPSQERVRAQGILWLSARWGGALTPILVVLLLNYVSWRAAFGLFGAIGFVWAFFFLRWYRDRPSEHPDINAAELALLPASYDPAVVRAPVRWKTILRSPHVWLLWIQYFLLAYGFMFYYTWLPSYLEEARKVKLAEGALLAGLPLLGAGLGSLFCGFFLARLARLIGGPLKARRLMAITGFGGSCIMSILSLKIGDPVWAMIVLGLAGFANDLAMPPSWGACMDLGGRYAGTLSGSMNMMGSFGGSVAPLATAYILEWTGQNWNVVFYASAAAYFLGGLCWLFLNPVTPLEPDSESHSIMV